MGKSWILKIFVLAILSTRFQSTNAFDIGGVFTSIVDSVEDVVDDLVDGVEDVVDNVENVVDSVGNVINSAATAVTGAAAATVAFFEDASEEVLKVVYILETVVDESIDIIEIIPDIFNVTTWEKLTDGAKLVISKLKSPLLDFIEIGCDFLLAFIGEWLPKPLDRLKIGDFETVADCINQNVIDYAIDWTKDVATSFVMMGNDLDFTPIFNTDGIEQELSGTVTCLNTFVKELDSRDSFLDSIIRIIPEDINDYFGMDDMTITIEFSFTACTLQCRTVSIGIATSINDNFGVFYSIGTGIDTSTIIGASLAASVGIYKRMDVMTGPSNLVSFDILDLPFLPDLPAIIIVIEADTNVFTNAKEAFAGFVFETDILDIGLGITSAFSMGFELSNTYWLYTTTDLKTDWNIKENFIDTFEAGGFIAKALVTIGLNRRRTQTITNLTLGCPTNKHLAGISSQLNLGYVLLQDVSFGNLIGNNSCNSTLIYDIVSEYCAFESECDIPLDPTVLGQPCIEELEHYLTVIYSCPYDNNVFDIGCYAANFLNIVQNDYFKDYKHAILNDSWETRTNSIAKCAKIARDNGHKGFGIYNHGMCIMTDGFLDNQIYNQYGVASSCPSDGIGDAVSMNVYGFAHTEIAIDDLGCFNESMLTHLSIVSKEQAHWLTQDEHFTRENAISKCAQIAIENSYRGFALYNNGSCHVSNSFIPSTMSNIYDNTNISTSCGQSRGTFDQYNVYSFPYIEYDTTSASKTGLTPGATAGLVIGVLLLISIIVVVAVIVSKKLKNRDKVYSHYGESQYKPPKKISSFQKKWVSLQSGNN